VADIQYPLEFNVKGYKKKESDCVPPAREASIRASSDSVGEALARSAQAAGLANEASGQISAGVR